MINQRWKVSRLCPFDRYWLSGDKREYRPTNTVVDASYLGLLWRLHGARRPHTGGLGHDRKSVSLRHLSYLERLRRMEIPIWMILEPGPLRVGLPPAAGCHGGGESHEVVRCQRTQSAARPKTAGNLLLEAA
jgi:hypothetical protein